MARHDLKYDDDIDLWLVAETKRQGISKTAVIVSILREFQQNQESSEAPTGSDNLSKPAREIMEEQEATRKLQATLNLFFKLHLASHPPRTDLTDEEEEALNERWEEIETIIDAEMAK